jgi:SAM-dependent methyltransferase
MRERQRLIILTALLAGSCQAWGQQTAQAPNRDPLGPADVEHYIEALASPERVAALKPERVIDALSLRDDAAVADLGAGPGVFTIPLAKHLRHGVVYAVDVEPRQLDTLRAKLVAQHIDNVVPVLASSSNPHLPPAQIDVVLLVDTYYHLPNRVAYFTALRHALAPDGRLAVLQHKIDAPGGSVGSADEPLSQMHEELESAGYALLSKFDFHPYHDFEIWVPSASF